MKLHSALLASTLVGAQKLSFDSSNYGFDDYMSSFGNGMLDISSYCKADNYDQDPVNIALNSVRGVFEMLELPQYEISKLFEDRRFTELYLTDLLKITEVLMENFDKSWCNRIVTAVMEAGFDIGKIVEASTGQTVRILETLGTNAELQHLLHFVDANRDYLLKLGPIFERFSAGWPTVEEILSNIDTSPQMSSHHSLSSFYNDEIDRSCAVMEDAEMYINFVKPLAVGLIEDLLDGFRGHEELLSVGKMIEFTYRVNKHLLLDTSACIRFVQEMSDLLSPFLHPLVADYSSYESSYNSGYEMTAGAAMDPFTQMLTMAQSGAIGQIIQNLDLEKISDTVSEFLRSEVPAPGEQSLLFEAQQADKTFEILAKIAPKMIQTIVDNAAPLMKALGLDDGQIMGIVSMLRNNDQMMNFRDYTFGNYGQFQERDLGRSFGEYYRK